MISDQKKKIQQTQYCAMGCGFLQLIKRLYYINQTSCRVILPPFVKPFLSAEETEHDRELKKKHWRLLKWAIFFIIFNFKIWLKKIKFQVQLIFLVYCWIIEAIESKNKALFFCSPRLALRARVALRAKYRVRPAWLIKRLSCRLKKYPLPF